MSTRTIHDTCNCEPVRSCDVQDVTVHLSTVPPARYTFVRGPGHMPCDVVDFALRRLPDHTRGTLFLTDPNGNVLYPADVQSGDEAREVLRKFRRASSVFLYLRLHGVTP